MSPFQFFYHWTHRDNLGSILACGLDPRFTAGKLPVIWFCEADRTGWALKHVTECHKWNPDDLVLIRFPVENVPYTFTAFKGVYTTTKVIRLHRRSAVKAGVLHEFIPCVTVRRHMGSSCRTRPDSGTQDRP